MDQVYLASALATVVATCSFIWWRLSQLDRKTEILYEKLEQVTVKLKQLEDMIFRLSMDVHRTDTPR